MVLYERLTDLHGYSYYYAYLGNRMIPSEIVRVEITKAEFESNQMPLWFAYISQLHVNATYQRWARRERSKLCMQALLGM